MAYLTPNLIKENLSFAYVYAVAAINGYSIQIMQRDSDGVDLQIRNNGKPAKDCILIKGQIDVQLKASINWEDDTAKNIIKFDLKAKNYKDLTPSEVANPHILVLFCLPKDETKWLGFSDEELILRKCAYWVSLKGKPSIINKETIRIEIPKANLFNPTILKELMIKMQS